MTTVEPTRFHVRPERGRVAAIDEVINSEEGTEHAGGGRCGRQ